MLFKKLFSKKANSLVEEQAKKIAASNNNEDDDDPILERELVHLINYNFLKVKNKAKELGLQNVPKENFVFFMRCADELKRTFNNIGEYETELEDLTERTISFMVASQNTKHYKVQEQEQKYQELEQTIEDIEIEDIEIEF